MCVCVCVCNPNYNGQIVEDMDISAGGRSSPWGSPANEDTLREG